jgi:phosphoribosylformylglycinamidine cyclo-ligase
LIGLPSTGLHTNGYSLARHIVFDKLNLEPNARVNGLENTIAEELMKVHRSYLKPVSELVKRNLVKGMAHITGGGFLENIPRALPDDIGVQIERVWPVPEIFNFLCEQGNIDNKERYRVFNMGIGMVLIIDKNHLSTVENLLDEMDEVHYLIGQAVNRKGKNQIKIN